MNDLVEEVLQEWLEAREGRELLPIVEAARSEWQEQSGVEAREFFRRIAKE